MSQKAKTKKELLKSDEFEKALLEGAEYKKGIMTTYKQQNKANFQRFFDVMLESNHEIKSICEKRRKNRTDDDQKRIKDFKSEVRQLYFQAQELMLDEKLEEGQKSKVQKIFEKAIPVISLLRFIGCHKLDNELNRLGCKLDAPALEHTYSGLSGKAPILTDIFSNAKSIKEKVNADNQQIEDRIFTVKVPVELQFDKDTNNAGLKAGDFKKLVDVKAKLIMAQTEDAKSKVAEKIEHIASEKQFEAARAELVRDSLTSMA